MIIIIILSFITYILANGVWCIPLLAWIYPALFLWLVQSYPSSKMRFIIWGIYAFGFIIRFTNVIGMDFWLCAVVAILIAVLYSLPYLFWQKSQKNFNATVIFAVGMVIVEYAISSIYPILGGLSDAYTQYKNSLLLQIVTVTGIYGMADYFKSDTKTLAAQIMISGRFTVYSYIGDIFVYLCIVYLVGNFIYQIKKQKNVSISDIS